MSAKEWFGGIVADWEDPDERVDERRFWLALLKLSLCVAALAFILSPLLGCATQEEITTRVCFMKLLGQTMDGMSVVGQQCMTPEAFQESQK